MTSIKLATLALSSSVLALAFAVPRTALAQQAPAQAPPAGQAAEAPASAPSGSADCPPGSWFCGDAKGNAAASGSQLQPLPGGTAPAAAEAAPAPAAPPVVVYQPAPPPVVVVQGKTDAPAPYRYTPRPDGPPYKSREWGMNFRLSGAMLGKGAANNASMGGFGGALRFRPSPYVGIDAGLDLFSGTDYNGDRRREVNFSLGAAIFVNPRSRVQVYFPMGFDWAAASVQLPSQVGTTGYSYFGGHLGAGLEFRVSRHFALNLAVLGFLRDRRDVSGFDDYEFVDANTGRRTNASGGGLGQLGMTVYF